MGDPSPSSCGSSYRVVSWGGDVPGPLSSCAPRQRAGDAGTSALLSFAMCFAGSASPSLPACTGVNCLVHLPAAGLPSQLRSSRNRGSWFAALCHKSKKRREKEGRKSIPSSCLWLTWPIRCAGFIWSGREEKQRWWRKRGKYRYRNIPCFRGSAVDPHMSIFHPSCSLSREKFLFPSS